jgi:hypothetical protein
VHHDERRGFGRVTKVIAEFAFGDGRTRSWLDGGDAIAFLFGDFFLNERES